MLYHGVLGSTCTIDKYGEAIKFVGIQKNRHIKNFSDKPKNYSHINMLFYPLIHFLYF